MSKEESNALVIDAGSAKCKVGFAGNESPLAVFPSTVARGKKDTYVGDEADFSRRVYPIQRGVIADWEYMERVSYVMFLVLGLSVGHENTPYSIVACPAQCHGECQWPK